MKMKIDGAEADLPGRFAEAEKRLEAIQKKIEPYSSNRRLAESRRTSQWIPAQVVLVQPDRSFATGEQIDAS